MILGVLHGYAEDGFYSPSDDKVLATAIKLKTVFDQIYVINQNPKLGLTLIGRYKEDSYNGNGDSKGNPWFLTTIAMAELCYRAQREFLKLGLIKISLLNKPFLILAWVNLNCPLELWLSEKIPGLNLYSNQFQNLGINS